MLVDSKVKFRAWDKSQKKYVRALIGSSDDEVCPLIWSDEHKDWVNCDTLIIQRSTGLFDKNKVEIFEGDKVKYTWGNRYPRIDVCEVHWGSYSDDEYVYDVQCWLVNGVPLSDIVHCMNVGTWSVSIEVIKEEER